MTTFLSNDLDKQLHKLKELLNHPLVYLGNYFGNLRNEIKTAFGKKQQNTSNPDKTKI